MVTARPLNKRTTTIAIAAVLALGTGLLMYNYLTTVSHVASTVPMRTIVVATHDIPARTLITGAMVTTADRPADSVDPDAAANATAVVGQMALISIPSGGTLSSSKVGQLQLGGLTVRIPQGQRAISIAIDHVKGVSNLIQAGDHVDVLAIMQAHGTDAPRVATILRNTLVLAMGTALEVPVSAASPVPDASANTANQTAVDTATLSVTPAQAQTLSLADLNATLRLDLRSPKDVHETEKADVFRIDAPAAAAVVPAAAAPAVAGPVVSPGPKASPHAGILIIDGDQIIGR